MTGLSIIGSQMALMIYVGKSSESLFVGGGGMHEHMHAHMHTHIEILVLSNLQSI